MGRKTVVFDLDGTLADTSMDLLASANHCFRKMGFGDVLITGKDAGIALRGGRMMLAEGLKRVGAYKEATVDQYYPVLLAAYGKAVSKHTKLYPGALEAVRDLQKLGFGVGICTNKPEGLARQLLTELGALENFEALVGGDSLPVRKPDPKPLMETVRLLGGDPKATLLVGDSDTDRNTSKAAHVPSILVTFGPSGADMAALEPEALLDDFAALPAVVTTLLGPA